MSLSQLKSRRDIWASCFLMEDRNSIINQAYQMIWNSGVFRVINEARRIAPDNLQGHKEINGTVHYFIDECFFDSQLLAIRRLTDSNISSLDGKKGVYSLLPLLNDMKANISLMTRRNLFSVEGKEYDYEVIDQRASAYRLEKLSAGQGVYWLPPELVSDSLIFRHKQIDALSGVREDQRSPNDCVRIEILEHLINKLNSATEDIKIYVDKNIAHACTQESREIYKADQVSVTLGHLWEAHKIICQIINFVNTHILAGGNGGFLPTLQYDHFEFIDKPLVSVEGIDVLSQKWYEFGKEADLWANWGIKELEQEMVQASPNSVS